MAVKCEPQHELQDFKRNTVSVSVAGQELNLNPLVVNKETAIKKLVKRIFGNKCLKFIPHIAFFFSPQTWILQVQKEIWN